MNIKDLVEEAGYTPKRKSSAHGGEYASPCPFCRDGDDRFVIWPDKLNSNNSYTGGRYLCRVCYPKGGDAIDFIRRFTGLSHTEACARLHVTPNQRSIQAKSREHRAERKFFVAKEPPAIWVEKADNFVAWCNKQLMCNTAALEAVKRRGFTLESIERFRFGFYPDNLKPKDYFRDYEQWGLPPELKDNGKPRRLWLPAGFTIPSLQSDGRPYKVTVRRSAWTPQDIYGKYIQISGSKKVPAVYGDTSLPVVLILESEYDALLIQQEARDLAYCVALGGARKPIDLQTYELIKATPTLLFCPDYDTTGASAWQEWKKIFPKAIRMLTPYEKSAGDAFIAGLDLRQWIQDHLEDDEM